jgi:hypothetical protein
MLNAETRLKDRRMGAAEIGRKASIRYLFFLPFSLSPLFLVCCASGCGEAKGDVSGQVSFKGSPLPAGKVTFICEGGNKPVLSADIREGKYEIKGVPVGPVTITVATYKPSKTVDRPPGLGQTYRQGTEEKPPAPPEKYVEIPARYGQADRSKLSYDVKPGIQDYDIPLTP